MRPDEDEHLDLHRLCDELRQLERRVDALEHRTQPAAPIAEAPAGASFDFALPNAIPIVGRAILGLAGAYLLRALSEAGPVPRLLVVAIAILYAAAWLVFSVRERNTGAFASAIYGITAALILAPLLWEATVRFDILPPPATAGILTGFMMLLSTLAWRGDTGTVSSVTTLAIAFTGLALMVRTGDLVSFAAALLAIAGLTEAGAWYGEPGNIRALAAIAADFAIWVLLYVVTNPTGVPPNYKPPALAASLTLCALLFLIYGASIAWRAVKLRLPIAVFEIVQLVLAFALSAGGALRMTQGRAAASIGALCAIASAACYATAFLRFSGSSRRNHYIFASLGAALGLVACLLILPESLLTPIWSVAAVIATLAGARVSQPMLGIHGTLCLAAAGLTSGVPGSILNAFTSPSLGSATPYLWIVAIAAACCYAAWGRAPAKAIAVPALLSAVSMGALLILAGLPLVERQPTASLLAAARTLVTCALALALRFAGARTGRRELIWVSYAAIALGTVKLVFEDFRQSQPAALAVSLVCYGALLILAPRFSGRSSSISR